jgi:ornithine--oxo-acid transaminase
VTPDIICASKALSGGYVPVAAVLARDDVFRAIYSKMDRALVHSTTFKQNQLAMVAGLATLSVLDDEGVVEHARAMGEYWKARFAPLEERYELLVDVRGKGQMIGVEFGEPSSRRLRRWWRLTERVRPAFFAQTVVLPLFHRHRMLTQVAADGVNIIKLLPALTLGEPEIDQVVDAFDDVLSDALRPGGLLLEATSKMARGSLRRAPRAARVAATT